MSSLILVMNSQSQFHLLRQLQNPCVSACSASFLGNAIGMCFILTDLLVSYHYLLLFITCYFVSRSSIFPTINRESQLRFYLKLSLDWKRTSIAQIRSLRNQAQGSIPLWRWGGGPCLNSFRLNVQISRRRLYLGKYSLIRKLLVAWTDN